MVFNSEGFVNSALKQKQNKSSTYNTNVDQGAKYNSPNLHIAGSVDFLPDSDIIDKYPCEESDCSLDF